ncbi:hypothetical protein [Wolbachia endosymbiont of Wuchereria bancrofti]|uniref:hypothetical protein n=1 Tax=Wolbachia endosymbiont of Wuchereria bancrofti TaxID=96496 RepID=UPI00117CC00A|nr:hypothetical protein [Wolbachia endosymbiont of Wuchereria bancrofti]
MDTVFPFSSYLFFKLTTGFISSRSRCCDETPSSLSLGFDIAYVIPPAANPTTKAVATAHTLKQETGVCTEQTQ